MNEEIATWFATWWPLWVPFLALFIPGTVGGVWVIVSRRGGEKERRRNPLPPTWPEMWARIDAQDAKLRAQDDRIEAQSDEIEALKAQATQKDARIDMLIRHIIGLELLIPNPPGPPERPKWN